jgi:hypothetical protein
MRTSLKSGAGPMEPGLMRSTGTPVPAPQVSVMPQPSSIGTPSARYQRTSSGEIGAAPVTAARARWMPISLRTLFSTSQRASVNCSLSQAAGCRQHGGRPPSAPMPMAQP